MPTAVNPLTVPTPSSPVVTYRMGENLVYVKASETFSGAVDLAMKEFPEELSNISPHRITFKVNATLNGQKKPVRISESAWSDTRVRLTRGEVLDVIILDEAEVWKPQTSDTKSPPQYLEVPGAEPTQARCTCSAPVSRSPSPTPSKSSTGSSKSWLRKAFGKDGH